MDRLDGLYDWTSQACMILRLLLRYELNMNDNSNCPDPLQDAVISPNGISELCSSPPCKISPPSTTPIHTYVDRMLRSSSQNKYLPTHIRSHSNQSYSQTHHLSTHSSSSRCTLPPTVPLHSSYTLFRILITP